MATATTARIGLFGIGLAAYWPQFPGLKEAIETHLAHVESQVSQWADVVTAGVVDAPQAGVAVGERFASERIDLLMCYSGTYATSTQVLPVAQRVGVPVILLNLQPEVALGYNTTDTGNWLENCGICPMPELAGVFQRSGIPYQLVTGHLYGDTEAWAEVEGWCRAVGAAKPLRRGRFGMLGHTYPGMIDMSTDVGVIASQLGAHVEILEMEELRDRVRAAGDDAIATVEGRIERLFGPSSDISL